MNATVKHNYKKKFVVFILSCNDYFYSKHKILHSTLHALRNNQETTTLHLDIPGLYRIKEKLFKN